jgi:hypothetical protein
MSESSVLDTIVQAQAQAQEAQAEVAEEAQAQDEEEEAPPADERQLNTLLRKAEAAFTKGNKGLLLSRVECGKWCHAVYVLRQEQGHKDRGFTSQLIFNRLAVHADSKRECDASELARMYHTVTLLSEGDAWKSLTVGKVLDLLPLVSRVDGAELYSIFKADRAEQAKALFAWACGDGINKPSREDIHNRVLGLTDPAKYAERVEKEAKKEAEKAAAKEAGADVSEDEDAQEAPTNLIDTQARPAAPNWKDVPEGMVALYREACKQAPGHAGDLLCQFAKELVWTSAMVKGLLAGIANSKDAESAVQALQVLVDDIGEEYSIYPESELAEAA